MKEQLTNEEYIELMYAECEDCQFYGNRCHCQYEKEEMMNNNQELLDAKREAETWKQRFWDLKNLNTQLRDYEKSQAQIDVMRSFINIIDRVRNWSRFDTVSGDCLHEIVNIADADLEKFNVQVIGQPYELMIDQHEFFQFEEEHHNQPFTVIYSAYASNNEPWIKGLARLTPKGE